MVPAAMSDYELADWLDASGFPQAAEAGSRLRNYWNASQHPFKALAQPEPQPVDLSTVEPAVADPVMPEVTEPKPTKKKTAPPPEDATG